MYLPLNSFVAWPPAAMIRFMPDTVILIYYHDLAVVLISPRRFQDKRVAFILRLCRLLMARLLAGVIRHSAGYTLLYASPPMPPLSPPLRWAIAGIICHGMNTPVIRRVIIGVVDVDDATMHTADFTRHFQQSFGARLRASRPESG